MFQRVENSIFINKGVNPDIDSYSAFWDNQKLAKTDLCRELEKRHVTDVFICGLAYDICVGKRRENIRKELTVSTLFWLSHPVTAARLVRY